MAASDGRKTAAFSRLRLCGHKVTLRQAEPSEIHEGAGKLGIEIGRSLELAAGLAWVVGVLVSQSKIVVRGNELRIQDDGFLEMDDRILRMLAAEQRGGLVKLADGFVGRSQVEFRQLAGLHQLLLPRQLLAVPAAALLVENDLGKVEGGELGSLRVAADVNDRDGPGAGAGRGIAGPLCQDDRVCGT